MEYTVSQVARLLKVTERTVRNWIEQGHFPNTYRVNPYLIKPAYRIPSSDVEKFIKRRSQENN